MRGETGRCEGSDQRDGVRVANPMRLGVKHWNLMLRFILELWALAALAMWGWLTYGMIAAIIAPVAAAALWGVFAVPDYPSRSGGSVVPVPGWLRLLLEIAILCGASWALYSIGHVTLAITLAAIITFHYLVSVDRLAWLLKQ